MRRRKTLKQLLACVVRWCIRPAVWLVMPLLRLTARLGPLVMLELIRRTPKYSTLYSYIGAWANNGLDGQAGLLRAEWHRKSLGRLGRDAVFLPHITIVNPQDVEIGDAVAINYYTIIVAFAKITIGNDVLIGPRVLIHSGNHRFADPTVRIRQQGHDQAPIDIGNDAWIGAHAVILSGVRIGHGAVVAAGAVVTKDVEPYTVVAGIPARKINERPKEVGS